MGIGTYSREAQQRNYEIQYCGLPAPSAGQDRVCLIRPGVTLSAASTRNDFINAEVSNGNGYNRAAMARLVTAVDTTNRVLTIAEHGIDNGTRVFAVIGPNSSVISGLTVGTPYFVINSTTNTLQLALTAGGAAVQVNGMGTGQTYLRPSGSFDIVDNRFENVWNPAVFTAVGGTISYSGYFILRGAANTGNAAIASVNITTDEITTTEAHGITNGDEILISADSGTIPGGLAANTVYFGRAVSTTVFALFTTAADAIANSNRINITSTGSGTLRVRNATGYVDGYELIGSTQNILDSRQTILRIFHNVINSGNLPGQ